LNKYIKDGKLDYQLLYSDMCLINGIDQKNRREQLYERVTREYKDYKESMEPSKDAGSSSQTGTTDT